MAGVCKLRYPWFLSCCLSLKPRDCLSLKPSAGSSNEQCEAGNTCQCATHQSSSGNWESVWVLNFWICNFRVLRFLFVFLAEIPWAPFQPFQIHANSGKGWPWVLHQESADDANGRGILVYWYMVKNILYPKNIQKQLEHHTLLNCWSNHPPDTLQITATENMGQWLFNKYGTSDGHVAFQEVFGIKKTLIKVFFFKYKLLINRIKQQSFKTYLRLVALRLVTMPYRLCTAFSISRVWQNMWWRNLAWAMCCWLQWKASILDWTCFLSRRMRSTERWGDGHRHINSELTILRSWRLAMNPTEKALISDSRCQLWSLTRACTSSSRSRWATLMARTKPSSCSVCWLWFMSWLLDSILFYNHEVLRRFFCWVL